MLSNRPLVLSWAAIRHRLSSSKAGNRAAHSWSTSPVVLRRGQQQLPLATHSWSSSFSTLAAAIRIEPPGGTSMAGGVDLSRLSRLHEGRCFSTAAISSPSGAYHVAEFPSLVIGSSHKKDASTTSSFEIQASGSFAQATAEFLDPDPVAVQELTEALRRTNTGIVAHYYMDVELQGVLTAVGQELPNRIGIADSLRMGDMAVEMASGGAHQIMCLGVDFMAESVQAILSKNGFKSIPVYRADSRKIGCSLAESAEQEVYRAWLQKEGGSTVVDGHLGQPAMHVVYINTSLETKAVSSSLVPTITCTSSNVLQTLLQASAQMGPELKILYGPDTYMGHNLQRLIEIIAESWDDDKIARDLHSAHNKDSLRTLRENLLVFPSGNCVVHHMFGEAVVDTVRQNYDDCYVTAHLEVPGEMFEIAMKKSFTDDGVVGSTSDILKFIQRKVQEAASAGGKSLEEQRLRFILGTEAGMVTSIVQSVQNILHETGNQHVQAEIIFPVAQEAVTATGDDENNDTDLQLVPGVSGGEGCSTAGGCATCPFMKMNHLDAVMDVLSLIEGTTTTGPSSTLQSHLPPDRLRGRTIQGRPAMDVGSESILYMRQFMKDKRIPDELCQKIMQGQHTRELLSRS